MKELPPIVSFKLHSEWRYNYNRLCIWTKNRQRVHGEKYIYIYIYIYNKFYWSTKIMHQVQWFLTPKNLEKGYVPEASIYPNNILENCIFKSKTPLKSSTISFLPKTPHQTMWKSLPYWNVSMSPKWAKSSLPRS